MSIPVISSTGTSAAKIRAAFGTLSERPGAALRLILSSDFGPLRVWEFVGPRAVVIGRGSRSGLRLPDTEEYRSVSGYHCVIELSRNRAYLRDLGSLNGTFLNGHLVSRREEDRIQGVAVSGFGVKLADGDVITLAGVFSFRVGLVDDSSLEPGAKGQSMVEVSERCPSCGRVHDPVPLSKYADVLCADCRPNPLASLKLLKTGLNRRIKTLDPLKGLRITKTLGRGSTSAVFLAERKDDRTKMALKVMSPAISENDWARKSFLREVAIGRALKHPNVTKLYSFGYYAGAYFYLMEYCQGGNSEEKRLEAGGKLSPEAALGIVLPVLDGLNYIHNVKLAALRANSDMASESKGLVHRDLKPTNIFLGGPDGRVPKIADIGVGKLYNTGDTFSNTRTGSVAGSPATMPRQQVLNFKGAGPEVDIWAAAASLYKLLSGEYPRDFPENEDPWRVVLNRPPVPILRRGCQVPPHLAFAIDEALVDNPVILHQSAASLKKSLVAAAHRDGLLAGTPEP
ncbi:MAG: protein kinase [Deltaproteobacteria bacterium]|jgi:serine/threonine-protein kinase|nr:protein kinase [Deltaproteobacteria bacterium]